MTDPIARCCALGLLLLASPLQGRAEERRPKFRRPELVAVMWAPENGQRFQGPPPAAWRCDGEFVPLEELDWLFESGNLGDSQFLASRSPTLRPLILIFRLDDRSQRPQQVNATLLLDGTPLVDPDRFAHCADSLSTKHHLAAVRILPNALAEWPVDVTLDVKTQVAEPTVLHVLNPEQARACTPDKPLQVDKGVTWRIEPGAPRADGRRSRRLAVLSVNSTTADPTCDWSVECPLEKRHPLQLSVISAIGNCVEHGYELEDGQPIVNIEFLRRRFRVERYEQVPTHPELLPQ